MCEHIRNLQVFPHCLFPGGYGYWNPASSCYKALVFLTHSSHLQGPSGTTGAQFKKVLTLQVVRMLGQYLLDPGTVFFHFVP